MKFYSIILFLLLIVLLSQCKTQQEAAYELPSAMMETAKIEFAKQCDKGKVLYDITCARCHNTRDRKKEIIPDFTSEQLVGYELRVINTEHENQIPETSLTTEELGYIITFLSYKKKSGKVVSARDEYEKLQRMKK